MRLVEQSICFNRFGRRCAALQAQGGSADAAALRVKTRAREPTRSGYGFPLAANGEHWYRLTFTPRFVRPRRRNSKEAGGVSS